MPECRRKRRWTARHTHTHNNGGKWVERREEKSAEKKGEKNCRSRSAKMTATTDDGIHYYYCYYVLEKETIFTSFSLRHERFLAWIINRALCLCTLNRGSNGSGHARAHCVLRTIFITMYYVWMRVCVSKVVINYRDLEITCACACAYACAVPNISFPAYWDVVIDTLHRRARLCLCYVCSLLFLSNVCRARAYTHIPHCVSAVHQLSLITMDKFRMTRPPHTRTIHPKIIVFIHPHFV